MEDLTKKINAARRDLMWAKHIALQGQTADQRERGRRNVARLSAELKAMGATETETV